MFNLGHGEHHKKTIRRHWLVLLFGILPFALVTYLTLLLQEVFVAGAIWTPFGSAQFPAFPEDLVYAGGSLLILVLWLGVMHFITDFYLDTWIISDQRIVGILQRGFFSREINSFRLERIQDVQTNVHGFFPTLFNIGDVHVETAGHSHDLVMRTVGNPHKIRRMIMEELKKKSGSLHGV